MVYLVSSAESGVSATAAKPNISRLPLLLKSLHQLGA
jgi:hypothetical protein